jgi:putative ABC transport system ATP-binding protein
MNMITGIDRPTQGSVTVDGHPIHELNEEQLAVWRGGNVGIVFQFFQLLPTLTAVENAMLPLDFARKGSKQARFETARHNLELVGLGDKLDHLPAELSGGEQQRVAIARALASRPTVLFADEPTGNLDSTTGGEILDLMRESVDTFGQTTVMVTHEARAAAIADRILFLADGNIVRDLAGASQADVLATMNEIAAAAAPA